MNNPNQQQQQQQQTMGQSIANQAQLNLAAQMAGVPAHMMASFMPSTNSATMAASPLFPPTAMLSNPGVFLSQIQQQHPEASFLSLHQQQNMAGNNNAFEGTAAAGATPIAPMAFAPVAPAQSNTKSKRDGSKNAAAAKVADAESRTSCDLTPGERAKQNRDRNREHARSTRLRKKAYVQKLKELVEGLHAERTEEVRQRRVAIQHLAEMQSVRRGVVRSFLRFHSKYETEERKWSTILEESFWLKQPVTPYRSFRRAEIEKVRSLSAVDPDMYL
jgi:hypothetical protein